MNSTLISLSDFFHLPIRFYNKVTKVVKENYHCFTPDVATPHQDLFLKNSNKNSLLSTENILFYGVLPCESDILVIGPALGGGDIEPVENELALNTGIKSEQREAFMAYLIQLPHFSINEFAKIVCFFSEVGLGKKIEEGSLFLDDAFKILTEQEIKNSFNSWDGKNSSLNTQKDETDYENEKSLMRLIANGQTEQLKKYLFATKFKSDYAIGPTDLRNNKNIAIVSITLETRAAIEGGLDCRTAFSLSDLYIKKVENSTTLKGISDLMVQAIFDFSNRVGSVDLPNNLSPLLGKCCRYIQRNLTSNLSLESIASYLKTSPEYLSHLFKVKVGIGLTDYINSRKVEEAKRLLKNTDLEIVDISYYLNYSSQSYFQKIFKKYAKITPRHYREQNHI